MRNTYTITVKVTDKEGLLEIIDLVGSRAHSVEVSIGAPGVNEALTSTSFKRSPKVETKARSKRVSKVNTAILNAMKEGPASIQDLKRSLESAGMSAASLSTGIAMLIKSGEIERVSEGRYGLKGRQPESTSAAA